MTGVTLLELLVVITAVAILMGLAATNYKSVSTSSRITSEINGLLGDMRYARSEAIKQGQNVVVCVSTTGTDCTTGDSHWNEGWIVFVNSATPPTTGGNVALVLRAQAPFTSTDILTDGVTSNVAFDREGLALGLLTTMSGNGGAMLTLHDATHNASWTRCLTITNVGNLTVQLPTSLPACT